MLGHALRTVSSIVTALAHDGLHVVEGTLVGVFAACSKLLAPLAEFTTQRNAAPPPGTCTSTPAGRDGGSGTGRTGELAYYLCWAPLRCRCTA